MKPPAVDTTPAVLFADLNSFYASVEQMDRPEWRGLPLVVVQVEVESATVISASPEARALGVRAGYRVREAREIIPDVFVALSRHRRYQTLHAEFVEVARRILGPAVVVYSIDEFACHLPPGTSRVAARALAEDLKEEPRREYDEGLRCSVGVGANVFLAKVASAMEKPDGLVVLDDRRLNDFLALPLEALPGIGPATLARLERAGITTLPELLAREEGELRRAWGSVIGARYFHMVRGSRERDYRAPSSERRKTVNASQLLPPQLRTVADAREACFQLLSRALRRLRTLKLAAGQVEFQVTYRHEKGTGLTWKYHARARHEPADDDLTWRKAAAGVLRVPERPLLQPFDVRVNIMTWLEVQVWRRVGLIISERHAGVIQNLSPDGCFVLTSAALEVGTPLRVEVGPPVLTEMTLAGTVVHREAGRGAKHSLALPAVSVGLASAAGPDRRTSRTTRCSGPIPGLSCCSPSASP